MKEYIKAVCCGAVIGACLMQIANIAVEDLLKRSFAMGGEVFLPMLLSMIGYIGWKLAEAYFKETRYKEIYRKGYTEGSKLHNYQIIIPIEMEQEDDYNRTA